MSDKYTLIKEDLKKVGIGFVIAILGAVATWMESDLLNLIDFSQLGNLQVAVYGLAFSINSSLVNLIRKFIASTNYTI